MRILLFRMGLWLVVVVGWPCLLSRGEVIETRDGRRLEGRLVAVGSGGYGVLPRSGGTPLKLEAVRWIEFEPHAAAGARTVPPFLVSLGESAQFSGRLNAITADRVRLEDGPGGQPISVLRGAVLSLTQIPGESLVLQEGFEALDSQLWTATGRPEIDPESDPVPEGTHVLRLRAGGNAISAPLREGIASGRLELSFRVDGARSGGQIALIELTFRGESGIETLQTLLGWEEEHVAVRTRGGGPALALQPLERQPGWHRLVVRFQPQRTDITVDNNELAHGDGPGGPLVGLRLATESGRDKPAAGLALLVDDLRVVRHSEPTGTFEIDPEQDEARLISSDQLFGSLLGASPQGLRFVIDGVERRLSWGEVAGVYLKRQPVPARPQSGLWVRASWKSLSRTSPEFAEGVLEGVGEEGITLGVPYVEEPLRIPRDRLSRIEIRASLTRWVLDPTPHHLGNSPVADLDPPQPGGSTREWTFELKAVPEGPAFVALDVLQVVGIEGDLDFSGRVRQGELLTTAFLNGSKFDTLNRHVTTRNDAPIRIRLPIPAGLLRPGKNTLRLEQAGTKEDPELVDNLGIVGVAIESGPGG